MGLKNRLIEQAKNPKGFIGGRMLLAWNSAHAKRIEWGLSKIEIKNDSVILDIGCGGGAAIKALSRIAKDGRICGIDHSEKAVKTARRVNADDVRNGKVDIREASVSAIPFLDSSFEIVTAFHTIYFWPDLRNEISEVARVLIAGGQFAIITELRNMRYHMKEFSEPDELEELLLKSGFSYVKGYRTSYEMCMIGIK